MKLAVMQPYVFPYIGYFQLVNAVDIFVFYDDVNYMKKGWINRNRILVNNQDFIFSIPLNKVSQNNTIKETLISSENFEILKLKFLQTIESNYKKAPFYNEVSSIIRNIFSKNYYSISELAIESVIIISNYLKLRTTFIISSKRYDNQYLLRQDRLIDICRKESATHYINAIGGQELYKKEEFMQEGIQLDFIKSLSIEYKQFTNDFIPWLSIIDVLMFNDIDTVKLMLNKYELI